MSVYVVAQGRIDDRAMHDDYVEKAVPTLPPEAKVLAFDLESEVVEGSGTHPRMVLIEFPSREVFRRWYDSPEYQAILPMRLQSVDGTMLLAQGVDEG